MHRDAKFALTIIVLLVLAGCAAREASGGCPRPGEGEELLTNAEHGYCLTYPEGYTVERPNPDETVLVVGSILNTQDARLHVEVHDAEGRTAEEIADALEADVRGAMGDWQLEREAVSLDGEDGVALGPLPGQELNRRMMIVRGERLYELMFTPADEGRGDAYRGMEELYERVLESWRFTGE